MALQTDIPLYDELVSGFEQLAGNNESATLRQTREKAFENFRESGFPTIRNEDWKYTNLTRFLKDEYALNIPATPVPTNLIDAAKIAEFDCYTIVLINGIWNKALGSDLPKGVEILPVAEAKQDPTLTSWFSPNDKDRFFTALNTALFADGLFIRVKAGALPEKPIHIIHAYTSGTNLMVQPRHIWVAERNAELSLIESTVSVSGEPHIWINNFTGIGTQIFVTDLNVLQGVLRLLQSHVQAADTVARISIDTLEAPFLQTMPDQRVGGPAGQPQVHERGVVAGELRHLDTSPDALLAGQTCQA